MSRPLQRKRRKRAKASSVLTAPATSFSRGRPSSIRVMVGFCLARAGAVAAVYDRRWRLDILKHSGDLDSHLRLEFHTSVRS